MDMKHAPAIADRIVLEQGIGRRGPAINLRPGGTHADQHQKSSRARAKRELRRELTTLD
jgi:hypothetical protein